ncbi:MAG: hypothetical protein V3U45_03050, partial [bacterium]
MAVAFDDVSSAIMDNATSVSFTSHTVAGANRLLVVCVSFWNTGTVTDVEVDAVSITQHLLDASVQPGRAMFYQIAPGTGTHTIKVSFASATWASVGCISFTGVDQTTPVDTAQTHSDTTS